MLHHSLTGTISTTVKGANMKYCHKCGETKQKQDFYADANKKDGKKSECKACSAIATAKWRAANKDKHLGYQAKWRADNPGYHAKWLTANREKRREYQSKWLSDNLGYKAKWFADNPERKAKWYSASLAAYRIYSHARRARKKEVGGKLSSGIADRLFTIQCGKCACGCKQPLGDDYHLDHIMPLALGGSNTDNNIQLLRSKCNMQKSAKHPVDFMQSRGFLL